jgi:hypothetical protein
MTKRTESEHFIDLMLEQTQRLLEDHWDNIQALRDQDETFKVNIAYTLRYKALERGVKSTISFGRKLKDAQEQSFSTTQLATAGSL